MAWHKLEPLYIHTSNFRKLGVEEWPDTSWNPCIYKTKQEDEDDGELWQVLLRQVNMHNLHYLPIS